MGHGCGGDLAIPDDQLRAQVPDFDEVLRREDLFLISQLPTGPRGWRPERAQDQVRREPPSGAQEVPVERLHHHLPEPAAGAEQADQGFGVAGFALDERHAAGLNGLEGLDQRRHARAGKGGSKPAPGVEGRQFIHAAQANRQVCGGPAVRGVGGAVQRAVVEDDRHAVRRVVIIEFHQVGARGQRQAKGGQRVFRGLAAETAMGDDQRPGAGDE